MNCKEATTTVQPVSEPEWLFSGDSYITPEKNFSPLTKLLTWNAPYFYYQFAKVVWHGAQLATSNNYTRQNWFNLSCDVVNFIENNGGVLDVAGMSNFQQIDGPVIFVANHMSLLETIVLPSLTLKYKELCIAMKKQLFDVPVFGTLLTGFRAIAVTRKNPIEDYKTIIRDGGKAIKEGYSTLLFPQTTRTVNFQPAEFNSVGVKLAKRLNVPIIPIALKTDFWGNGRILKDIGPIKRHKRIYFRFGAPIMVKGNGKEENQQIIDFIVSHLQRWQDEENNAMS